MGEVVCPHRRGKGGDEGSGEERGVGLGEGGEEDRDGVEGLGAVEEGEGFVVAVGGGFVLAYLLVRHTLVLRQKGACQALFFLT